MYEDVCNRQSLLFIIKLFEERVHAYMVNNDLYTSIENTRAFLKDVSKGKIDISTGCKRQL